MVIESQTASVGDQYRQDMFFRYNQTFQYFLDQSSHIETGFGNR